MMLRSPCQLSVEQRFTLQNNCVHYVAVIKAVLLIELRETGSATQFILRCYRTAGWHVPCVICVINRSGWVVLGGFGLRSVQVYNMGKSSFILLRSLFFFSSISSL